MKEMIMELLFAVITAAVPVLAGFVISYINKAKDKAVAQTDDTKTQGYIAEIARAISDAVAATSQTYVDALKQAGTFDEKAQKEAAKKALTACLASISPAAREFIESVYGDIVEYLTTKIEAEVRKQKLEARRQSPSLRLKAQQIQRLSPLPQRRPRLRPLRRRLSAS